MGGTETAGLSISSRPSTRCPKTSATTEAIFAFSVFSEGKQANRWRTGGRPQTTGPLTKNTLSSIPTSCRNRWKNWRRYIGMGYINSLPDGGSSEGLQGPKGDPGAQGPQGPKAIRALVSNWLLMETLTWMGKSYSIWESCLTPQWLVIMWKIYVLEWTKNIWMKSFWKRCWWELFWSERFQHQKRRAILWRALWRSRSCFKTICWYTKWQTSYRNKQQTFKRWDKSDGGCSWHEQQ